MGKEKCIVKSKDMEGEEDVTSLQVSPSFSASRDAFVKAQQRFSVDLTHSLMLSLQDHLFQIPNNNID